MRFWIGIDGGTHVGICVWDAQKKRIVLARTTDRPTAVEVIGAYHANGLLAGVVIEDPDQNKPVFRRPGTNDRMYNRIAQNVGMVKALTRALIEDVRRLGITPILERPHGRKWTAAGLKTYSGYTGRTSQHARDAAKLVVQRNVIYPVPLVEKDTG